jgi:hypothetical protein
MARVQVGWKNIYEVTRDQSGAEISRRFVRREPIYKEVPDPSEIIKGGFTSAAEALQRLVQQVHETTRSSIGTEDDLSNRSAATNDVIASAETSSAEPMVQKASFNRPIKRGLAAAASAFKRRAHAGSASLPAPESTAAPESDRSDFKHDAGRVQPVTLRPSPSGEATSVESEDVAKEFQEFCRTAANFNPPAPLALDAVRLFKEFEQVQRTPLSTELRLALANERSRLESEIAPHQQRLEGVKGRLHLSPFKALWNLSSGLRRTRKKSGGLLFLEEINVRRTAWTRLGQARVSTDPEPIGHATRQQINRAARLLASRWSDKISANNQGVFSVYQDEETQQTIIQLAGGKAGSIFITLPGLLDPTDVARQVLEALRGVMTDALEPSDPVIVLNGAFAEINMKELIPRRVVLRSRSEQAEPVMQRVGTLYDRAPLTPENTSILSAMPESADDLGRLRLNPTDFDLWQALPSAYAQTIADRGFSTASTALATAPDFLRALQTKENVIVLVAHAESDCLYFPDGSEVRPADIEAMRDDISRNKPVVYLFCCETAQYTMVESISQTLLRCGAAAVVAPQETIRLDQSRVVLSSFLAQATEQTPVIGLRDAETETGNYSMEVWLG